MRQTTTKRERGERLRSAREERALALTRARRKLVFVAHPDLFRNTKYAWISTFTATLKTAPSQSITATDSTITG